MADETKTETTEETTEAAQNGTSEASSETDPLTALKAERDKLKDQLLRTAADFDNFRKRARKDIEDAQKRAKEDAIREVLPIADNLERAVAAAANATDAKSVADGVKMVLQLFTYTIERLGMERIVAVGSKFDPNLHEAIQQIETAEHAPGTVVVELAPGYRMGDRLVRAALVGVAKAPTEAVAEAEAETAEAEKE